MATINLSSPIAVQLISGAEIEVNNLQTSVNDYNVVKNTSIPYVSVGFHEAYDRNALCESGTITYQMVSDVNGDASPPLVGISSTSIFDQDPLITFETYFDRPKNSQTSQRVNSSVGIPSINLSGATFAFFQAGDTELVVQFSGLTPNPLGNFPSSGRLQLNKEVLTYTGISGGTTFTGVSRDVESTGPYTHTAGDYLRSISI